MSLIFLRLYSSVLLQWSQRKKCNTRRITSLIAWFHFVFQQKNHSRTENQEQIREGRGEILEVKFYMRNTHSNFSILVYALYLKIYFHTTLLDFYSGFHCLHFSTFCIIMNIYLNCIVYYNKNNDNNWNYMSRCNHENWLMEREKTNYLLKQ